MACSSYWCGRPCLYIVLISFACLPVGHAVRPENQEPTLEGERSLESGERQQVANSTLDEQDERQSAEPHEKKVKDERTDLCEKARAVQLSGSPLDEALHDVKLNVAGTLRKVDRGSLVKVDSRSGELQGFSMDILKLASERAGFEFTAKYVPLDVDIERAEGSELTKSWDRWIEENGKSYDLLVNVFESSPELESQELFCPYSIADKSVVVVTQKVEQTSELDWKHLLTFFEPFTPSVWMVLATSVFLSGVLYWWLEGDTDLELKVTPDDKDATDALPRIWFAITYGGLQIAELRPQTTGGRLFGISWAFSTLILVTSYGAILVSCYVNVAESVPIVGSLSELVSSGKTACVSPYVAGYMKLAHPELEKYEIVQDPVKSMVAGGQCDAAVTDMNDFQLKKLQQDTNPSCRLTLVEMLQYRRGCWSVYDAYVGKCTSLVRDVLEVVMHQLDSEGALKEVWEKQLIPYVQTRAFPCDDGGSAGATTKPEPLGLDTMAGIFILHACFLSLALLLWYFR